ncbi:MAG: aminotransferase class I/II-fold pyridoxal phosphate-dependent enzyme, partial [Rhodobacteraceae bacterium]|nr:aminotransferase class I/II-fold pyridoxal phosphate-dependent enzyme [Paracoccaceae bacterium]
MPNSQTLIPKPGILDIALYQSGASALPGQSKVLKLSANENPLGPSRAALGAVQAAAAQMHRYPTTDHAALRNAIGAAHGLDPEQIICGVGSDEVLQFLAHAYAGPGDEVIYTEHGFSMYPILARMVGAKPVMVPEAARVVDVGAILAGVTARTKIVYLTNPGNPTATILPDAEVARLAAGLPGNVVLVIDGAYAEYVSPTIEGGRYDSGASLVQRHHNVIMTRTFSKIYGLGGLRIGWG